MHWTKEKAQAEANSDTQTQKNGWFHKPQKNNKHRQPNKHTVNRYIDVVNESEKQGTEATPTAIQGKMK